MKTGIRTEVDWELVGAELAQSDDHAQIEFFKSFIKECKSWGTNHQVELQLAHVNVELTDDERECLAMLSYMGD